MESKCPNLTDDEALGYCCVRNQSFVDAKHYVAFVFSTILLFLYVWRLVKALRAFGCRCCGERMKRSILGVGVDCSISHPDVYLFLGLMTGLTLMVSIFWVYYLLLLSYPENEEFPKQLWFSCTVLTTINFAIFSSYRWYMTAVPNSQNVYEPQPYRWLWWLLCIAHVILGTVAAIATEAADRKTSEFIWIISAMVIWCICSVLLSYSDHTDLDSAAQNITPNKQGVIFAVALQHLVRIQAPMDAIRVVKIAEAIGRTAYFAVHLLFYSGDTDLKDSASSALMAFFLITATHFFHVFAFWQPETSVRQALASMGGRKGAPVRNAGAATDNYNLMQDGSNNLRTGLLDDQPKDTPDRGDEELGSPDDSAAPLHDDGPGNAFLWSPYAVWFLLGGIAICLVLISVEAVCSTGAARLSPSVFVSRSTTLIMPVATGIALSTISRRFLTMFRKSSVQRALSTDELQPIHRAAGYIMVASGISHGVAHFFTLSKLKSLDAAALARVTVDNGLDIVANADAPFLLTPYITGLFMLFCAIVLAVTGTMRAYYNERLEGVYMKYFSIPHSVAAFVLTTLMAFHGSAAVLGSWNGIKIVGITMLALVPITMMDRLKHQFRAQKYSWRFVETTDKLSMAARGVVLRAKEAARERYINLTIPIPSNQVQYYSKSAGQYVLLSCDQLSIGYGQYGWHPFSICGVFQAEDGRWYLQLFIRELKGFTHQLLRLLTLLDRFRNEIEFPIDEEETEMLVAPVEPIPGAPLRMGPQLRVRGPYCSEASLARERPFQLLVAFSTGVTPFMFLFKQMVNDAKARKSWASVLRFVFITSSKELANDMKAIIMKDDFASIPEQPDLARITFFVKDRSAGGPPGGGRPGQAPNPNPANPRPPESKGDDTKKDASASANPNPTAGLDGLPDMSGRTVSKPENKGPVLRPSVAQERKGDNLAVPGANRQAQLQRSGTSSGRRNTILDNLRKAALDLQPGGTGLMARAKLKRHGKREEPANPNAESFKNGLLTINTLPGNQDIDLVGTIQSQVIEMVLARPELDKIAGNSERMNVEIWNCGGNTETLGQIELAADLLNSYSYWLPLSVHVRNEYVSASRAPPAPGR